jgi:hypothetical protein
MSAVRSAKRRACPRAHAAAAGIRVVQRQASTAAGSVAGQGAAELDAGGDAELGEDLAQVVLDRARGQEQPGADLRVRQPVGGREVAFEHGVQGQYAQQERELGQRPGVPGKPADAGTAPGCRTRRGPPLPPAGQPQRRRCRAARRPATSASGRRSGRPPPAAAAAASAAAGPRSAGGSCPRSGPPAAARRAARTRPPAPQRSARAATPAAPADYPGFRPRSALGPARRPAQAAPRPAAPAHRARAAPRPPAPAASHPADQVLQQRRLACPRLTVHHQHPALTRAQGVDKAVQHATFGTPIRQPPPAPARAGIHGHSPRTSRWPWQRRAPAPTCQVFRRHTSSELPPAGR